VDTFSSSPTVIDRRYKESKGDSLCAAFPAPELSTNQGLPRWILLRAE
jgi:hypothetical protein